MGRPTVIPALAAIADYVGVELGTTDWVPITQDRIDSFANATGDHQWIHTDVERARRESPFEETVAHGYLTLALAPALLPQILRIDGWKTAINSGIEKMRLSSPVLAGARVRMSALIRHSRNLPRGGVRVVIHLEFEVEGSEKPACVADVIYVYFPSA